MTDFESQFAYSRFAHSVRTDRRFVHTPDTHAFLRAIVASAERRVEVVSSGVYLWRAQKGCETIELPLEGSDDHYCEDYPYSKERMKPLVDRAREGRANPQGIPYLYLATHRDTAVAEVRPWKGGAVSVGQFRTARELRLVNTTRDASKCIFIFPAPSTKEREESVWGDIDSAFSLPTAAGDDSAEYIPTQIMAESFRDAGFDGVVYRSAYGEGHNVVLFSPDLARQINCFVVRVADVRLELMPNGQHSYTVKDS